MDKALEPSASSDAGDPLERQTLVAVRRRQLDGLLRRTLGAAPDSATHLSFGHDSISFAVRVRGRDVIVRTHTHLSAYESTVHNLDVLRALDIPVPEVMGSGTAVDESPPFAWMITTAFRGRDLRFELAGMNAAQVDRLAEQVADFQFRAATLPRASRYGFASIGAEPPHDRWADVTIADSRGRFEEARAMPLLQPRVERIERAFADRALEFAVIEPICFLDDLTTKNVIIQDGELTGVVDFDGVCYGDRRYHVALTQTGVVADVGSRHLGYVDRLSHHLGLTAADRPVTALYSTWFGVEFLRDAPLGTEWADGMLSFVDRWLTEADA